MELQLAGRTAVVTGASSGLGRAIASVLAAEGVRVAAVARRKALLGSLAAEAAASGGGKLVPVVQDLMAADAAPRLLDAALAALGQVDILINCAGGSRPLPVDASDEAWEEAMTLNFVRQRQIAQALLPQMLSRQWGRIVNVTGKSEIERLNAANAAKAAMHAWAKGLSREVGRHGITVNSIAPGRITSEQMLRLDPADARVRFAATEIPLGRYGRPEELACLVLFLCSPLAAYITGTVIPVDGGLRRYAF